MDTSRCNYCSRSFNEKYLIDFTCSCGCIVQNLYITPIGDQTSNDIFHWYTLLPDSFQTYEAGAIFIYRQKYGNCQAKYIQKDIFSKVCSPIDEYMNKRRNRLMVYEIGTTKKL